MDQAHNMGDKGKGNAKDDSPPKQTPQPYRRGAFSGVPSGRTARPGPTTSAGSSRDQDSSRSKNVLQSSWRFSADVTPTPVQMSSPPKHQRKSLESAFGAMGISRARFGSPSHQSSEPVASSSASSSRKASRQSTFSGLPGGFPNWSTMLRSDGGLSPLQLAILKASGVSGYDSIFGRMGDQPGQQAARCERLFNDAISEINAIRKAVDRGGPETSASLEESLADTMADAIFGSNSIESVGGEKRETLKLCREILLGQRSHIDSVPVRSDSYWRKLERIIVDEAAKTGLKPERIRQRREIVNHAAALTEMTNVVVKEGQPFTEDLIKDCHKILCHEVDAENGDSLRPWKSYAGVYRSRDGRDEVAAGNTNFVVPQRVASAMTNFVANLDNSLRQAELQNSLDPFMIAANACGDFVNIHPFFDGNGRLCRLILSTIMLKYAGTVVAIGETARERTEYLEISKRRSEMCEGNGELAGLILKQAMPALGSLRKRLEAARGR